MLRSAAQGGTAIESLDLELARETYLDAMPAALSAARLAVAGSVPEVVTPYARRWLVASPREGPTWCLTA